MYQGIVIFRYSFQLWVSGCVSITPQHITRNSENVIARRNDEAISAENQFRVVSFEFCVFNNVK